MRENLKPMSVILWCVEILSSLLREYKKILKLKTISYETLAAWTFSLVSKKRL